MTMILEYWILRLAQFHGSLTATDNEVMILQGEAIIRRQSQCLPNDFRIICCSDVIPLHGTCLSHQLLECMSYGISVMI